MDFWLGTHRPNWLERTDVPLMVSARQLAPRRSLPRAHGPWVLDSGGFSELSQFDGWQTTPKQYVTQVRRYRDEIGRLVWAAQQDWMCEPLMLSKTGLSVATHQALSLANYLELRDRAPEIPWLPVLQGWHLGDYQRHVDLYTTAGVDLSAQPMVGVGTVCRRQHTMAAIRVLQSLRALGLRLHGFGLKITSLLRFRQGLASADSMAWSIDGRYPQGGRCPRHRGRAKCNNCLDYALLWRGRLLDQLTQGQLWNDD